MKKIIVGILALVMMVMILTGCGETHTFEKHTHWSNGEATYTYKVDGQIVSESVYEMFRK